MKKYLIGLYLFALLLVTIQHCDFDAVAQTLAQKDHTIFRLRTTAVDFPVDRHSTRVTEGNHRYSTQRGRRGGDPGQGLISMSVKTDSLGLLKYQ